MLSFPSIICVCFLIVTCLKSNHCFNSCQIGNHCQEFKQNLGRASFNTHSLACTPAHRRTHTACLTGFYCRTLVLLCPSVHLMNHVPSLTGKNHQAEGKKKEEKRREITFLQRRCASAAAPGEIRGRCSRRRR